MGRFVERRSAGFVICRGARVFCSMLRERGDEVKK